MMCYRHDSLTDRSDCVFCVAAQRDALAKLLAIVMASMKTPGFRETYLRQVLGPEDGQRAIEALEAAFPEPARSALL